MVEVLFTQGSGLMSKAEELYEIYSTNKRSDWSKYLKKIGTVDQKDINEFLSLAWHEEGDSLLYWVTGSFISDILNTCYSYKIIEIDANLVNGELEIGTGFDWDGILVVKGDVKFDVGYGMKKGVIIIEGDVKGNVGEFMKGGMIIVNGFVGGFVGNNSLNGVIVLNGELKKGPVAMSLLGTRFESCFMGALVIHNKNIFLGKKIDNEW